MILEEQILGRDSQPDADLTTENALGILRKRFSPADPPTGYLQGRTEMRNSLADQTGCSLLHAETVIERLLKAGKLHYHGDSFAAEEVPASWTIDT